MVLKSFGDALGVSKGGALRAALDRLLCGLGLGPCPDGKSNVNTVAFTVAVVALAAKIAKADGVVTHVEAEAFQRVFKTPPEEAKNVQRIFDLAKQDSAGFESYARQISGLLANEPQLKRDVFEGLFHVAAADGILHRDEESQLRRISEIFGFTDHDYRAVRALFVDDPDDPYTVLDVAHSATNDEIKTRYRKLVRENHPDALIARGVPEEFVEMATRKIAAINAAYEVISKERGL
ncbi:MAG: DnaJ family molecular chaperone [Hyphomicrobiaceae bacterium]|nr:DnaJ family molecular chaperone [Hyphomicrobiaceae bacterium]